MARIPVSFAYGPKDLLPSTHRTGTFYAVTDEGEQRLYVDLPDGMRLPMGITESDVSDMLSGYVREYQLDRKMDKFGTYEDNPDGWGTLLTLTQDTLISSPYGDSGMYLGGSEDVAYFRKGGGMLELDGADESTLSQNGTYLGVQGQSYSNPAVEIRGRNKPVRLLVNGKEMSTKEYVDTSVYSVQSKINSLSSLGLTRKMVEELPHNYLAEPNTIYLIPSERSEQDNGYDEYLVVTYDLIYSGMNWGVNCSSFVNLTGTNIRSSVSVEYAIPTYISMATDAGESYIITLVSPEDKSIGYTITIPFEEVDASLDMVLSDIENCLRITDTWSRWVLTLAFDGTTAVSLIAYSNDKSLELIGTTLVDLESKMDKFGRFRTGSGHNIVSLDAETLFTYGDNCSLYLGSSEESAYFTKGLGGLSLDFGDETVLSQNGTHLIIRGQSYDNPAIEIRGSKPVQLLLNDKEVTTTEYVDGLVDGISTRLSALETSSLRREVVERLPEYADRKPNIVYMVPNTSGEDTNYYDEYLVIEKSPTPVDAGGWVPVSPCLDENGDEIIEGGLSYCYVASYQESGPSGEDLCEVTFVDRFDPERKIIIWARLDELQATNLVEYFVASTEEYTNDVHRFYFNIHKQANSPNVNIYVAEIPRDLEFIGTTKCDLTGKQDKFAEVLLLDQTAVLKFMSNEGRKFYDSVIRICDQSNIGIVITSDLLDADNYKYGVTLHCDGPGGQGLNVIVEPTPRTDNSATSKTYVDTQLSNLRQEYEQLQQTVQELSEQLALKYLEGNTQS